MEGAHNLQDEFFDVTDALYRRRMIASAREGKSVMEHGDIHWISILQNKIESKLRDTNLINVVGPYDLYSTLSVKSLHFLHVDISKKLKVWAVASFSF